MSSLAKSATPGAAMKITAIILIPLTDQTSNRQTIARRHCWQRDTGRGYVRLLKLHLVVAPSAASRSAATTLPAAAAPRRPAAETCYVFRGRTLGALANVELNALTLIERLEPTTLNRGMVDEQILTPVLRGNEPESFVAIEPLYCSLHAHVSVRKRACACGWAG